MIGFIHKKFVMLGNRKWWWPIQLQNDLCSCVSAIHHIVKEWEIRYETTEWTIVATLCSANVLYVWRYGSQFVAPRFDTCYHSSIHIALSTQLHIVHCICLLNFLCDCVNGYPRHIGTNVGVRSPPHTAHSSHPFVCYTLTSIVANIPSIFSSIQYFIQRNFSFDSVFLLHS